MIILCDVKSYETLKVAPWEMQYGNNAVFIGGARANIYYDLYASLLGC